MMSLSHFNGNRLFKGTRHIALGLLIFSIIAVLGTVFYMNGRSLMTTELRERLKTLSTTASLLFNAKDLEPLRTDSDIGRPEYAKVIRLLNEIRRQNPDIRFAYIIRPTNDLATFEFVADADSLHPYDSFDLNKDGVINEEDDLAPPGTPYDVSETPAITRSLTEPSTTDEPYSDQWGTYMSGFAPILGNDGKAIAVIGFDIDISNFQSLTNRIFSPFAFLLILSAGIILAFFIGLSLSKSRKDAAQRMDEERNMLLQLSSHQLGSPLAILRWSLEELKVSPLATTDESLRRFIETAEDVAKRIAGILSEFQEAERVHSGIKEDRTQSIDAATMTTYLRQEVEKRFEQKKQTLVLDTEEAGAATMDRSLIGGILRELLINASDFSPNGSPIVLTLTDTGSMLRASVQDVGSGIPKKDQPHLFQPFTRASNASVLKPEGSGLGLYIAEGIIRKMGGKMWIKSEEKKGTTVSFEIPKVE